MLRLLTTPYPTALASSTVKPFLSASNQPGTRLLAFHQCGFVPFRPALVLRQIQANEAALSDERRRDEAAKEAADHTATNTAQRAANRVSKQRKRDEIDQEIEDGIQD